MAICKVIIHSAALLLITGIFPQAAIGKPMDEGGIRPPISPTPATCVPFTDHYCNRFENFNAAFFPNPRGHKTLDEAKSEFNDFIPLLQSGCHEKLGTLLCFIYFPFCDSARPSIRIYPCTELCEEVHNSLCTNLINNHGSGWNTALQCNNSIYRPISSNLCANGAAPDYNGMSHNQFCKILLTKKKKNATPLACSL